MSDVLLSPAALVTHSLDPSDFTVLISSFILLAQDLIILIWSGDS